MFILESHLSAEQNAALAAVQAAAGEGNLSLFLAGGAMRDMLGGFPIRDLDFTVEGPALKLAKAVEKKTGARMVAVDEHRKSAELEFRGGARCEIAMARQERYGRAGTKPVVTPATIHEDLRGRDFTVNAIALSLNRASRGLMIDPTNGASDLDRKELRAVSNYSFYDDPVRMLRLMRLKTRLGFAVDERTEQQYRNAREAGMEKHIGPRSLFNELHLIAFEPNSGEVLKAFEEEGLLKLYTPALMGAKLNMPMFQKLQKLKALIPFGAKLNTDEYGLFLYLLTQLLNAKERSALIASTKMLKAEMDPWQKLEPRAKKLESALKSVKLTKGSQVYDLLKNARGEEILLLHLKSAQRLVQDRIRNYFTKYLPMALEVTDAEVTAASGLEPSNPKFAKARQDRINGWLDGRIKKPVPPPEPEPAPVQAGRGPMGRSPRFR